MNRCKRQRCSPQHIVCWLPVAVRIVTAWCCAIVGRVPFRTSLSFLSFLCSFPSPVTSRVLSWPPSISAPSVVLCHTFIFPCSAFCFLPKRKARGKTGIFRVGWRDWRWGNKSDGDQKSRKETERVSAHCRLRIGYPRIFSLLLLLMPSLALRFSISVTLPPESGGLPQLWQMKRSWLSLIARGHIAAEFHSYDIIHLACFERRKKINGPMMSVAHGLAYGRQAGLSLAVPLVTCFNRLFTTTTPSRNQRWYNVGE